MGKQLDMVCGWLQLLAVREGSIRLSGMVRKVRWNCDWGSGRRERKQRRGWGCVRPKTEVRLASNPTVDVSFCAVRVLNLNCLSFTKTLRTKLLHTTYYSTEEFANMLIELWTRLPWQSDHDMLVQGVLTQVVSVWKEFVAHVCHSHTSFWSKC